MNLAFTPELDPSTPRKWWARLVVLGIALLIIFAPLLPRAPAPTERHFRIEAKTFQFTPSVLKVNPGDRVTIDLVSTDVAHGFYLDSYGINVTADPGQTAHLTFVADKSGVFRFRCPVACGQLHPFMTGKLVVGPNLLLVKAAALGVLAVGLALWELL